MKKAEFEKTWLILVQKGEIGFEDSNFDKSKTCVRCSHWDAFEFTEPPEVAAATLGVCRRYPPSGAPTQGVRFQPTTFPTQMCGEFQPAPAKEPKC